MKTLLKIVVSALIMLLTQPSLAVDFDTNNYDQEVTSYLLEIHERLLKKEMNKADLVKYHKQLVQTPTKEQLTQITEEIFNKSKKQGQFLSNQSFVIFTHRLILGQYSPHVSYSKEMVNEDMSVLKEGQASQFDLLKKRLHSEIGQDRMAELVEGYTLDADVDPSREMASDEL